MLLPRITSKEALPQDAVLALDAALEAGERPYGPPRKSDRIPEQLLKAEPGGKLYPNLVKKVEAVCTRGREEVQRRCREALAEQLLQGGQQEALDTARREAAEERATALQQGIERHALALAQSDHQPVAERLALEEQDPLHLLSWNVLEFPSIGASKPVVDGVGPYCDQLQKSLDRKGSEEKQLLLDAMTSEPVISRHYELVLQEIRDALVVRGVAAALLQEVSTELGGRLTEVCAQQGWDICLSAANEDPGKCDAITAIISREPLDEKDAVVVQENKKVRSFAAARLGTTWLVSCHVPHEEVSKKKGEAKGGNVEVACRVLRQLAERLPPGAPGPAAAPATALAAVGDLNADVRAVAAQLGVPLLAPAGATQLGIAEPIDGVLLLR